MGELIRWLRGLRFWLGSLFRRGWWSELDEEMTFHLERETQKLIDAGMSPAEAWRAARLQFGSTERTKEQVREARGVHVIEDVLWDLKYAVRQLRRSPAFTASCVVTLALGIGATTAIVSVVYGVLLQPLPYAQADRLAVIWENDRFTGSIREAASLPDFIDFEQQSQTFESMAAFQTVATTLTGPGREPSQVQAVESTHDLFDVLGLPLAAGRWFDESVVHPGGDPVAVLGHGFWRTEMGASEDAIGQTLILDDESFLVIGVAGLDVEFPARADVWLPLREDSETIPRYTHPITVVGRLGRDRAADGAQTELSRIASELEAIHPENRGRGVFVEPLTDVLRGDVRSALWVLLAGALTVLLIACVNVANLLLARGATRAHEVAIASALGASRSRMARRFLVESGLLTGSALALGAVLSYVALHAIGGVAPPEVGSLGGLNLEWPVLLSSLVLCGGIGVIFGMLPTRQAGRLDIGSLAERRSSGSAAAPRQRGRRLVVVAQTALAVLLLVGAGLLVNSLIRLQSVDPGFATDDVLHADFRLPESRYPRDFSVYPRWVEVDQFNRALLDRLENTPGVEAAAIGTNHPLDPGFTNSFRIVGRQADADQGELVTRIVSEGYFATTKTRVLQGRGFTSSDNPDNQMVMMVNEATAARYFPDENPIGNRIALWGFEREIVGIVADERMYGFDQAAPPAMYLPLHQAPGVGQMTLMVRASADPRPLVSAVRNAVRELDADVALYNVATMEETVRQALARWRFTSLLLSAFALVALLLAAVGVNGVLSFLVARRTREFGIRMAIGATRRGVLSMVLGQGMMLIVAGLALGLVVALPLSRLLESLLFGVSASDPTTYVLVAVTLAVAALVACVVPAMRATGVDPVSALRVE
jgi:putative ABC transport system permease protein